MKIGTCRAAAFVAIVGLGVAAFAGEPENRTIDGSGNNLVNPEWGSTHTRLRRAAPSEYADAVSALAGETRENPRVISNAVFTQNTILEGVFIPDPRGLTDYVWAWGQFLAHDTDFTPDDSAGFAFINIPPGDFWFDPDGDAFAVIPFRRSLFDPASGTDPSNPREQINVISTWIDASMVYGSDQTRADWLRTFEGGRLKTSPHPTGDLMPFNDGSQPNTFGNTTDFFVAGDVRSNEHLALQSLHTLFVREHNRLADEIAATHPDWSDEQIYQRARRIVGAEIQAITYNEYLPTMLGKGAIGPDPGYDPTLDPSLTNVFATAAFRMGHSQVGSIFLRLDENGEPIPEGHIEVLNGYFLPELIVDEGGVEPILRGMAAGQQQRTDVRMVDDLRNFLFNSPGNGEPAALDLAAVNIQRGRDHGLAHYNAIRVAFGLTPKASFEEISSDPETVASLASVYEDVNDIDPWVGMLAEDHLPGSSVGETVYTILVEGFERLRAADRFWHERDEALADRLPWLSELRLRDIILLNSPIGGEELQTNVFQIPCPPDLNGDGEVDGADLAMLLARWGSEEAGASADLSGDGVVDSRDLMELLAGWGACY